MLKELPVYDHVVIFHTHMLVLYVFSPETIVIVEVVDWLHKRNLCWNSLDVMNFGVRLAIEVRHTTFGFWFDLKVCNCHFLFKDACSLFSAFITFNTRDHLLCD